MRLTSRDAYWRTIVEAVSASEKVSRFYQRGSNAQITIPEEHFRLTALRIEGFHPTEEKGAGNIWGAWVP
eukprot:2864531-Alexandrium_andersonii.AAC.1